MLGLFQKCKVGVTFKNRRSLLSWARGSTCTAPTPLPESKGRSWEVGGRRPGQTGRCGKACGQQGPCGLKGRLAERLVFLLPVLRSLSARAAAAQDAPEPGQERCPAQTRFARGSATLCCPWPGLYCRNRTGGTETDPTSVEIPRHPRQSPGLLIALVSRQISTQRTKDDAGVRIL